MRKYILIMISLFALTSILNAQGSSRVSGNVIDGSVKTVESATITLMRAGDSAVIKIGVADRNGHYQFEGIGAGTYLISVSAAGHQPAFSKVINVDGSGAAEVPTLELIPQVKSLGNVTVAAKKPLIEQKIDRTVVNVEASVTNVGNSALEVLEKSPGVTVDKDGNISLKGKSGVIVMIDGRQSYLSGADLANLLKSMNASQLDQIEIMTNPPAKYDAAGNSGVINIKTKKNKQFGYNGSFTTGYTRGRYNRFNESMNFNYRNGKFNFFTNLNYNRNHRGEELYITRNMIDPGTKNVITIFDQVSRMENSNHYYNARAGVDYFASKKTTIGIVLGGYTNPGKWNSITNTEIREPDYSLRSTALSNTSNDRSWKNISSNVNFTHVFDSTGQELTADLDFIKYRSSNAQPLYTSYYNKFGGLSSKPDTVLGSLPQDITIYSGKMDYSRPLKNGAKFEAGIKSSYVTTDNNARYDSLLYNVSILDSGRSNHFIYKEQVNAAYVNFSRPLGKKWNAQAGLRLENTNATGDSRGYAYNSTKGKFEDFHQSFDRHYTQLFPTLYLQYKANDNNSFVINYGRRINRPDYSDLNPFINFLDRYTFEKGNPNLKPQFSHNVELSHTYRDFLTTTLNYSHTTDIIQDVLEQNSATNETFIKKANIATRNQFGVAISANKQIKKWWSGNIYLNVANNQFRGIVNNESIATSLATVILQVQQQFKWEKGWSAEISGFFRSRNLEGVLFIRDVKQMNIGFGKQILKNKASIRLNARDIFKWSIFRGYSKYGEVDAKFKDVNDNRSVSLSFTWRFSKGKLKASGSKKESGASDEQQRVKGGN